MDEETYDYLHVLALKAAGIHKDPDEAWAWDELPPKDQSKAEIGLNGVLYGWLDSKLTDNNAIYSWLIQHYTHDFEYYVESWSFDEPDIDFWFTDPKIAMAFKLVWC